MNSGGLRTLSAQMSRLVYRLRRGLGTAGVAGLVLIALAAAGFAAAPQLQREAQDLQAKAQHTRQRVTDLNRELAAKPSSGDQLAKFQAWFPTVDQSVDDLRVVFDAARSSHVDLTRGEYGINRVEGSAGLSRFDVVLPVRDSYVDVKAFVATVLERLPHSSLEELRIERPAAAAEAVEVRVHFALFYRDRG